MMILCTGGSGRLGQEIQKIAPGWVYPTHEQLDIVNLYERWSEEQFGIVVHCAGYTDVLKAETDKKECLRVNFKGTYDLIVNGFPDSSIVYISSEYAAHGDNVYSESKRLAEETVARHAKNSLIIRTLFKPRPYPHEYAFMDQYTQGDYVDVIAKLIVAEVNNWDGVGCHLRYIGTGRKSMFDLAKQTSPDVKPNTVEDITGVSIPKDYL